ncbi:hypothetical protein [Moraxella ovis]|nr:hypothetical protein [Moraxella ovis]
MTFAKTFKKTWQTTYDGMDIVVNNGWNFLGQTTEEIIIDGKQVHYYKGSNFKRFGFAKDFYVNDTKITVKVGSSWHCCGVACQIFINDEFYYGDKKVLFANFSAG